MKFRLFYNQDQVINALNTNEGCLKFFNAKNSILEFFKDNKQKPLESSFSNAPAFYEINMQENPDLFIIDCDTDFSYNYFNAILQNLNISTQISIGNYGGAHIFFKNYPKDNFNNLKIRPRDKISLISQFGGKLNYKKQAQNLDIDLIFAGGQKKLFEGNGTLYRKIINIDQIADMPEQIWHILKNLTNEENNAGKEKQINGKPFYPNKNMAKYILSILEGNKELKWSDLICHIYKKNPYLSLEDFIYKEMGGRNNSINFIYYSLANSCYLEPDDIEKFILLFFNKYQTNFGDFSFDEIYKIINYKKSQYNKLFFMPDETEEIIKKNEDSFETFLWQFINNGVFLGKIAHEPNEILVIKILANNLQIISIKKSQLDDFIKFYNLEEFIKRDDKGKVLFSHLPYIDFSYDKYGPNNIEPVEIIKPDIYKKIYFHIIKINTAYFNINPALIKALNEPLQIEPNKLKMLFKSTPFFEVLSKNIFPNAKILYKFLGDLSYYLINFGAKMPQYPIIRGEGGIGKDATLAKYSYRLINGLNNNAGFSYNDNKALYTSGKFNSGSITADRLFDRFKEYLIGANLITISETNGIALNKITNLLKSFAGNDYLMIEQKNKDNIRIKNNLFFMIFCNSMENAHTLGENNRRFYVSDAVPHYDMSNKNIRLGIYKQCPLLEPLMPDLIKCNNEFDEFDMVYNACEDIILNYLIYIMPKNNNYEGLYKLPTYQGYGDLESNYNNLNENENLDILQMDMEELLLDIANSSENKNHRDVVFKQIISDFMDMIIDPQGNFRMQNLEYLCKANNNLAILAKILYTQAYLSAKAIKMDLSNFNENLLILQNQYDGEFNLRAHYTASNFEPLIRKILNIPRTYRPLVRSFIYSKKLFLKGRMGYMGRINFDYKKNSTAVIKQDIPEIPDIF